MSAAAAIQRLASGPIRNVLIYNGRGVTAESVIGFRALFSRMGLPWEIGYLKVAADPSEWDRGSTLLVMPGGKCSEWDEELVGSLHKIRRFVREGGFYLGTCAGGYYAANESCYRLSEEHVLLKRRALSLFPGVARGPIFFNAAALDAHVVSWEPRAVTLKWGREEGEVPVLVLGGPEFVCDFEASGGVEVLAQQEFDGRSVNAIVRSTYGVGLSILLNFPPEVEEIKDVESFKPAMPLFDREEISKRLAGTRRQRVESFVRVLLKYGAAKRRL